MYVRFDKEHKKVSYVRTNNDVYVVSSRLSDMWSVG